MSDTEIGAVSVGQIVTAIAMQHAPANATARKIGIDRPRGS
ncbi:Uncharacterised protein [Mycobacteroides abscessus subsp. abscessus]|nr:Uncharacterised protein [Mycobacteroides abscessus subsp. abscessus]